LSTTSSTEAGADIEQASVALDNALDRLEQGLAAQAVRTEEIAALTKALEDTRVECEALKKDNEALSRAFANSEKKRLQLEAGTRDTSTRLDTAIGKLQNILAAA